MERESFLGVSASLSGRKWARRSYDPRLALALSQRFSLPSVLAEIMVMRGVTLDTFEPYYTPTLRALMPDPLTVRDMEKGAQRLAHALLTGEKVGIISDYDVDGMASAALVAHFFKALGGQYAVYFPDRCREGYGPSRQGVDTLLKEGVGLLLTLDCGVSAHDALEYASQERGCEVIVVDHHGAPAVLPNVYAVINPNRGDDSSGLGYLCAAGVAFFFLAATCQILRRSGMAQGLSLLPWLDLVALATVCDMVPLVGLNRAYVTQGLKIMAQRGSVGIAALCDVLGMARAPDVGMLGFHLGPRLNAAGRMGEARLGFELLMASERGAAHLKAQQLDSLNRVRQMTESHVLESALAQVEHLREHQGDDFSACVVWGEDWHPGILGLIASRLVERYHKPAFVLGGTQGGDRMTGSARSVPGIDLGALLRRAKEGLLVKGGGHAMAAGMTLLKSRLEDFRLFVLEECHKNRAAPRLLECDGVLQASGVTLDFISLLEKAGPFGMGNPTPIFVFPEHRVMYADVVGTDHIRCTLRQADGRTLKAMAFRAALSPMGEKLLQERDYPLHIAGRVQCHEWNGKKSPQLLIEDVAVIDS